jgi:SAM-dependent methyltransferase
MSEINEQPVDSSRAHGTFHIRSEVDHRAFRRGGCGATLAGWAAVAAISLWPPNLAFAWGTDDQAMTDEITQMLAIKPGDRVAEIGAGNGAMAVRMARKVGPTGLVFATEIDPARIEEIRERVHNAGLNNVTVVTATPTDSGLSAGCCDAAYMLDVYHHVTDPAATDASIFRALKPDARLLLYDFPPTIWLALFKVNGVPANRGGHGVADDIVINEMSTAGFREVEETRPWHAGFFIRDKYCLVFSKPGYSAVAPRKPD